MASFFLGAVVVSALGGPLLVGLLVGGLAAWALPVLRRTPPWTPRGRAAWRARGASVASALRLGRAWWTMARAGRRPWPGGAGGASTSGAPDEADPWVVDAVDAREAARFDAAFAVRCEVVSDRLQVWHSTDTGRAYEVDVRRAPADARPGDAGWLAFEDGRPSVRRDPDRPRVLN
jgi:hypothetical protein